MQALFILVNTTPVYTDLVENTVLLFAYPPWHHLPLPAPRRRKPFEALRWTCLHAAAGL